MTKSPLSRALPVIAFTGCALFAFAAHAGPPVQGAAGKRFRFHGDTEFFGFSHFDPDGAADGVNAVGFGVGRPSNLDNGGFTQTPIYGLGFGYVFAQDRAIVGGKVSLVVNSRFDDDGADNDVTTTTTGGYVVPYFQWMFMPGNWARPYVEVRFGFGGGATRTNVDGPGGNVETTTHTISPVVGVGGGGHLFIIDAFSIDLGLNVDYFAPHARVTGDGVPDDAEDWDEVGDLVAIGVLLGFSAWF